MERIMAARKVELAEGVEAVVEVVAAEEAVAAEEVVAAKQVTGPGQDNGSAVPAVKVAMGKPVGLQMIQQHREILIVRSSRPTSKATSTKRSNGP